MMQDLRENTKIIMILVALSFVGLMVFEWGMDISGRSVGLQTGSLGQVNGDPIPYQAYTVAYQNLYDQMQQQTGGSLSPAQIKEIEDAAFNEVVTQVLLQQELERRGITVSDEEIRQAAQWSPHPMLMQNELFMTDGRFDIQKYQEFLASPAANEQLLLQLEQYYRGAIPRTKLMRQVTAGTYITDAELWQAYQDRVETATVDYVALDIAQLAPGEVTVSDAEIEQYYENNEEDFERGATIRATVAALPKTPTTADTAATLERAREVRAQILAGADFAELAASESADAVSASMGGSLGTFSRGQMVPAFEEVAFSIPIDEVSEPFATDFGYHLIQVQERTDSTVTARHILFEFTPSEEALDQRYALADSLETIALEGGLTRAAQATGARIQRGITVSEDASFIPGIGSAIDAIEWAKEETELATGMTLSPVFETPEAFYLVELDSFTPAGQVPLEEASEQIRRELIVQKKRAQAREVGTAMVAEVGAGKTLEAIAQAHGLEVRSTGPFTRIGFNPVLGQANAATGAAFGVPIGSVSDVVETTAGLFIIRPTARQEADHAEWEAQKEAQRMNMLSVLRQQEIARWMRDLREQADIVDQRDQMLTTAPATAI